MKLKIYTDGACSGNPGKGGWAAIILDDSNQSGISGSESNTTNNRMELMAPIMALEKIRKKSEIIIFTDSKYVKDGITVWIKLDNACLKHKVTWKWVKAHSGNKYNNLVDGLAVSNTK